LKRPYASYPCRLQLSLSKRAAAAFFACLLLMMALLAGPASAADESAQAPSGPLQLLAKSAILMDAETGQVLYEYNADQPLPPASMAKMMTEYLVLKAVKAGKLKWDDVVTVQDNASKQIGSKVYLAKGDKHTVKDLYIAVAVGSANDAAAQLAETVAGSEENFAKLMNETAKQLGMKTAHFINATGLDRADMPEAYRPTSIDGETEMSARDAAILAYHILKEEPEFLEYSSIQSRKFRPTDKDPMVNWDWMLASNKDVPNFRKFAYPGVDGLKTGHTTRAGNCFTGTSLQNGIRLIAVVMGVPGDTYNGQRFLETAKLFDYGFHNFEKKTLLDAKSAVPGHEKFKVKSGKSRTVPVVTAQDITMLVPKGQAPSLAVKSVAGEDKPLQAPVKTGDKVGSVTYTYTDPALKQTKEITVDLIAAEDDGKASWLTLMFRGIGGFFAGLFKGIVNLF